MASWIEHIAVQNLYSVGKFNLAIQPVQAFKAEHSATRARIRETCTWPSA